MNSAFQYSPVERARPPGGHNRPAPVRPSIGDAIGSASGTGGRARFDRDFRQVPVDAGSGPEQLSLGAPGDRYEQEAEHAARQVMQMPEPAADISAPLSTVGPVPLVQRAGVPYVARACDQATTHLSDAPAAIELARAEATRMVNAAIPIVLHGLHDGPQTWNGMIAHELLDRHFHCPRQEQMEYILTTLQEIGALLPTINFDCLGGEQGRAGEHFTHDAGTGLLYRNFFHDSPTVQAGTLITLIAQLLGRSGSCNRRMPCYNDFVGVGPAAMAHNAYSYGYFCDSVAGEEVVPEPPGGVTCRPPEPATPSDPPSDTLPEACSAQGRVTSRQIVFPQPPARPHVFHLSSPADGEIYEELHDGRGRFICVHGRRVDQSWE